MQLVKRFGGRDFEYRYFFVEIPGHRRIELENADAKPTASRSKKFKLFGVTWN